MTSFEEPEASLLVEHLLPSLLGASHSLSQEIRERALFFGELSTMLETLRGRLTVISSPRRVARDDSQYPWLWRYVSHFTVGAKLRAVQHAKLWAFHWKSGNDDTSEWLELHVSSTNLTTSAFKAQIQAGWRVSLQLGKRSSQTNRDTWGKLIPFLDALGVSAGEIATGRIDRLVDLLGRATCPADVTFIASVPGGKSSARQLRQFAASQIHILTPTIGDWSDQTLLAWGSDAGIVSKTICLKWIPRTHPWTSSAGWSLSAGTYKTLHKNGVQLTCLPDDVRLTDRHRDGDLRWSHAKLYLLRSGRSRHLLITSANWSLSAWGAGRISPRNFELGIVLKSEWKDLETLGVPFDPPNSVPFLVERVEEKEGEASIEWAEASWDGRHVVLGIRSSKLDTPITAVVMFSESLDRGVSLNGGAAKIPWEDVEHTPLSVLFRQGTETLEVDVLDLRMPAEFARTPLPEIDPSLGTALREAFLLQRYGGPVVDLGSIEVLDSSRVPPRVGAPVADYSVQAWLDARAAFQVVDRWRAAVDEAKSKARIEPMLLEQVQLDGKELRALYARREGPAASLVLAELGWRIGESAR